MEQEKVISAKVTKRFDRAVKRLNSIDLSGFNPNLDEQPQNTTIGDTQMTIGNGTMLPMTPTQTVVRVHFRGVNGEKDHLTTAINLSEEDAHRYYIGRTFNIGIGGADRLMRCVMVETMQVRYKPTNVRGGIEL